MKDASESSNIVSLTQRLDPSSERGGALLNTIRDIAGRRLQILINGMFEHVDDALFDLAEKAENNAAQMHYFDGMREVRKRRPIVERGFLGQISRDLSDFASSYRNNAGSNGSVSAPLGSVELSLVADNELEESLAITSMIGKNETRLTRDLFAVNQRLSVIYGGVKIDDATNPVGPAALSQAFRQAMRELNAEMRVKLIIYKLFDRYVLASLDELYQEINAELVQAGVLPQLRHEISRSGGAPRTAGAATQAAEAAGVGAAEATFLADDEAGASSELIQTLRTLFSARRTPPVSGGTQRLPAGAVQLPSANELIGALSVLQSQAAISQQMPINTGNSSELAGEVQRLKEHLLAQIGSLRGEKPSQVSTIDEDTIDLVGMLFEFILEDRNLPTDMQVLLARLQIPYLKAAILDRKLFAHRQHPARRLLDALADAAKGWSAESDRDHRLHDKIKSIVDRLLQDFDDDMTIFERLCAELQEFQDISRRRAELAEQRVAESTRGREKLEQARRRAAREILSRIEGQHLPPLIHGILSRAWANYLVLTILRQGEESSEFRDALRFANDFIESTKPARTLDERRALRQMLPGIERALRRGLANVAFQESDIDRLLAQLHTYYRHQLGEAVSEAEVQAVEESTTLPIPESIQPIAESEAELSRSEPEPEPAMDTPEMQLVAELKPGTWLEFVTGPETIERAKLSWISPMSGRYLFVNRRGLKVADYAPHELAQALASATARVLESSALFDRALDAIVGRLSQPAPSQAPTE
ncbi:MULTISPECIES: DUF1631 domain-containing protein [unclassified Dyella]|uniref:DUF1631 domain-containing protein n=1 Tax=unclassified Dyella TaxID=2634549 RepID=UPI000C8537FF|nr:MULTISPECIES: DUF1631 domain-containing protein [unclassified Dyella]MDR3444745.1 DUF1631 domain-containing protein [Dyella sp.]PMQ06884.1 hypothetical protein DyAD56_03125 [Dyella sp. AD56]